MVRQWQYQIKAEPVYVPVVPPAVLLGWWQQPSEPIWVVPPRLEGGHVAVYAQPEWPIPELSWWQPATQQIRFVLPRPPGGHFAVYAQPQWPIPECSWWEQASEPVWTVPPRLEGGHFAVYAQPEWPVPLLSWWQQVSEPVREIRLRWYVPAEVIVEPILPVVIVWGWYIQASEPSRAIFWRPEGGHFATYALPEWPVLLSSWWIQASEPVREILPRYYIPWREFQPETVIPAYDWLLQAPGPIRIIWRPSGVIEQPLLVVIWGWYVQASEPRRDIPQTGYILPVAYEVILPRWPFMQPRDYLGF